MEYPNILYVKVEDKGSEDEFLNCTNNATNLSEPDSQVQVARYKLERIVTVDNQTRILDD